MKYHVHFYVNGDAYDLDVPANKTMLDVLRDELCLTGTKEGCGAGECGACTVIVDDVPLNACLVLAPELDGVHITTVEGLSDGPKLSPLQQSFIKHGATNTLSRISLELRTHAGFETADRVEQAHHAVLHQVVDLDTGRQAGHQMIGDTLYERSEALYQLILVDLASGVIHGLRRNQA